MSKFDKNLDRMQYLMDYDNTINESKKAKSGVEYHTTGADGKEYGIIREGLYYYIKTSTPDRATLAESYDYINGYDYRSENRFKSYNEATKHLELRLMQLNESKGIHKDVTVANVDAANEAFGLLKEESRTELNRMHEIFESSFIKKGVCTGAGPVGDSAPFTEKATAEENRDNATAKKDGTVSPDNTKVTDVESKMTSVKDPKGSTNDGNTKAKCDLDGECVATKEPKGAKPIVGNMNEGIEDDITMNDVPEVTDVDINGNTTDIDTMTNADVTNDIDTMTDADADAAMAGDNTDINGEDIDTILNNDSVEGNGLVGDDDAMGVEDENDLDALLREYEEIFFGDNKTLTGEKGTLPVQTCDTVDNKKPETECGKDGCEKTMKGENGTLPVQTCDRVDEGKKWNMKKIDEAIDRITDNVYNNLVREAVSKKIDRIVKEELTNLNAWGKHPRYGKAPMTTPPNKEVLKGTADRDFNDDSAKGDAPYGRKKGSTAPYDKTVDMITDQVFSRLMETLNEKK